MYIHTLYKQHIVQRAYINNGTSGILGSTLRPIINRRPRTIITMELFRPLILDNPIARLWVRLPATWQARLQLTHSEVYMHNYIHITCFVYIHVHTSRSGKGQELHKHCSFIYMYLNMWGSGDGYINGLQKRFSELVNALRMRTAQKWQLAN